MINGPGKYTVKTAAFGGNHYCGLKTAGSPAVKALAEQINELDGIEIHGRACAA